MLSITDSPFARVRNLPEYALSEIAKRIHSLRQDGIDIIDCSQMNPSMEPPQVALDYAVQGMLKSHNHRYSASMGIRSLRESFSLHYKSAFSATIPADQVVVTSGTKEGLSHLLLGILSAGDTVLVPVPSYPVHTASVALAGAGFVGVPLWNSFEEMYNAGGVLDSSNNHFFQGLAKRFSETWPRPKVILTAFPHNPTTSIVTACFYERLLDFATTNNCYIINDFAHGDLFFSGSDRVSLMSLPGAAERAVELYSLSKGFNLGGWRIGCAVGAPILLEALKVVKSYVDFGTLFPLQTAAAEMIRSEISEGFPYLSEVRERYEVRRDIVVNSLLEMGLRPLSSKATPFVWVEQNGSYGNADSYTFARELLENAHVALFPGSGFDVSQKHCLRISIVEGEHRLRSAMKRIQSFI